MKVRAPCPVCAKAAVEDAREGRHAQLSWLDTELAEDGVTRVICEYGHESTLLHTGRRHQVLFESGCKALLDGYSNEAVSSVAAALERSYEFFVRVASRKVGIDAQALATTWKNVSAQSERQLGGFLLLYALVARKSFVIDPAMQAFRNSVIHRGRLVGAEDAYQFAEKAYGVIRGIMGLLRATCEAEMWAEINDVSEAQREAAPSGLPMLSATQTEFDLIADLEFVSYLEDLRERVAPRN
jgi:hypothetical protein